MGSDLGGRVTYPPPVVLPGTDDFVVWLRLASLQPRPGFELRGYRYDDARANFKDGNAAEVSIAHAPIDWWKPEIYLAKYERVPGSVGRLIGYEFENTFQLTQQGEYWADVGFLASYEHTTVAGAPDAVEFGPLVEKTTGRFAQTFNFIWEKQVRAGASGKGVHSKATKNYLPGLPPLFHPSSLPALLVPPPVSGGSPSPRRCHFPAPTTNLGPPVGALGRRQSGAPPAGGVSARGVRFF